MGIKKNLRKLLSGPTTMKIREIQNILEHFGYRLARISGSHHIFTKESCDTITVPAHHQKVKKHYLTDIKERLASIILD